MSGEDAEEGRTLAGVTFAVDGVTAGAACVAGCAENGQHVRHRLRYSIRHRLRHGLRHSLSHRRQNDIDCALRRSTGPV